MELVVCWFRDMGLEDELTGKNDSQIHKQPLRHFKYDNFTLPWVSFPIIDFMYVYLPGHYILFIVVSM